jgi:4-hydroxy-3-methylbut-2-enyl diphosphate reductase
LVSVEQTYFRRGFGLKQAIEGELREAYHSALVDRIRASDYRLTVGDVTFRLARAFGFCYGVDRAVEYAYETRRKFPGKRIFLVGEIIHNPHVNGRLEGLGISLLPLTGEAGFDFSEVKSADVVIIPAFGVTVHDLERLKRVGCVLVDTTCGSVLNVWKRVELYAREGFTAVVHGKHLHEETKATASQVSKYPDGKYLIVRDMTEAEILCRFVERGDNAEQIEATFRHKVSSGFVFERDLARAGIANQTTMLAGESLAIARRLAEAFVRRYGPENADERFRSFDTICSATQERQDAVEALLAESIDLMLVVGGYNSSNTNHLAKLCARSVQTYHIADASCIEPDSGHIRHKPVDASDEVSEPQWLHAGAVTIGITAGASTPNNKIGEAIERVLATRGIAPPA